MTVLSPNQFAVLRQAATEPPGYSEQVEGELENGLKKEYRTKYPSEGAYACVGCGAPLYYARSKFNSGCGWPAFYDGEPLHTPPRLPRLIYSRHSRSCVSHAPHPQVCRAQSRSDPTLMEVGSRLCAPSARGTWAMCSKMRVFRLRPTIATASTGFACDTTPVWTRCCRA
jgi:hypothetical protein